MMKQEQKEYYKNIINGFKDIIFPYNKEFTAPSEKCISISLDILVILDEIDLCPAKISSSMDSYGGIMFEFVDQHGYRLIEVFNDGDIVYLKRNEGTIPEVFDISFNDLRNKLLEE